MEVLEKTFKQMPQVFTSNQFNKQAVKNGYPAALLKHSGLHPFLHKYAKNSTTFSKTWTKNKTEVICSNESTSMTEMQMIQYLKSKGYKILKPVNEWQEL
jgi:hypothetical protein